MSQPDFTSRFRAGLASGQVPPGTSAHLPDEAARRFAVYRNNVAHSLGQALARRYPVIQRLVGAPFFAAMAPEFIAAYPPQSPVLQEWGDRFARFLAEFPPVSGLPYLPEVARIEWARGRAYHAADVTPIDPAELHEDHALKLHPSVQVLHCAHPAFSIWKANQPGCDGRVVAQGGETVLVWRQPDLDVGTIAVNADAGRLIEALRAGTPLSGLDGLGDPVPVLGFLLREHLICSLKE